MEVQCKSAKASVRELGKIKLSSSKIDSYQLNDILEKYSINTIINKHFTVWYRLVIVRVLDTSLT